MSRAVLWAWIPISLLCASANAAPQQVLNKTVTVSFSHYIPAHCDNGADNQTPRNVSQQLYISTKGRVFAKLSANAGSGRHNYSREGLTGPGASSPFHFSGNKLLGTFASVSGARQEIISFDASYTSCRVEVVTGRESGKPYVWTNLAGVRCTGTGQAVVSSTSCSVSEGNPFAQ
jgi:hypothetical protein